MSESENEDHSRGMLAFVLSLDIPGAFVKASTKVLQSQVKKFVEDDLNNRLPDVLESLGADQDNLEKIAETLAELGGEAAGEFAAVLGVPLLNSVLRCVKDASIKKKIGNPRNVSMLTSIGSR